MVKKIWYKKICKGFYFNPAGLLDMVAEPLDVYYLVAGGMGQYKPEANEWCANEILTWTAFFFSY